MKTSIVLTTYYRPNQLLYVLRSIWQQSLEGIDYEILVVDDGFDDPQTRQVVNNAMVQWGINLRYIHAGCRTAHKWRTMGFAANIGIRQATVGGVYGQGGAG